ncbi:proteolipid protein 2 isoform 2-T2 [Trichechus inunguis]
MGCPRGCAQSGEYTWRAGRGCFRGGSHLARPPPALPASALPGDSLSSSPWGSFPVRRQALRLGVQRPQTRGQASRSPASPGTPVHAMADSERLSAPGCWIACTNFLRSRKGILLFAEIILCLVIMICFSTGPSSEAYYSSLPVFEMIMAAVFFVIYMCDLHTKIPFINWPWSDFFRALIAAILFLIISIVVLASPGKASKVIAGVLGLVSTCLFGYDAYITFPFRQQRHTAAPTDPADGPV